MSENLDDIINEALLSKEERWKKKRGGLITASPTPKLASYGRNKEKEPWGKTAISYLYSVKYERRTSLLMDNVECKAFEFGHENEPLAINAIKKKYGFFDIRSCSDDYDDIVFNIPFDGFGDSPDANIYNKKGVVIGVAEAKCNISQEKFEKLLDVDVIDSSHEYYWQFISHFIGTPTAKFLVWGNYDAYNDEIHCVILLRKNVSSDIAWLTNRIKSGSEYVDLCLSYPKKYKLSDINNWHKQH